MFTIQNRSRYVNKANSVEKFHQYFSTRIIFHNALFFLLYGVQCFKSKSMILEFNCFGLTDYQPVFTGILQLPCAFGVLTGFKPLSIGLLASAGLKIMMLIAFLMRLKIGDGLLQSAPSIFSYS